MHSVIRQIVILNYPAFREMVISFRLPPILIHSSHFTALLSRLLILLPSLVSPLLECPSGGAEAEGEVKE